MNKRTLNIRAFLLCASAFIIIISVWSYIPAAEKDTAKLLYVDGYGIHKVNLSTGADTIFFNTEGLYQVSISPSPSDTLIGVLIAERGYTPPGEHDYTILPKNSLLFINMLGNKVAILAEDVRKYSWSPEGDKVAFITGTYYEGGVGFRITGVGIFDLKSGSITKIKKDFPHVTRTRLDGSINEGGGFELYWAKHDTNIYIQDFDYMGGIYRYNTKLGKSEKVDLKGIDISPDGMFYKELEGIRIYRTLTNEDITEQLIARLGPEWSRVYLSWVFDKGHCLHIINLRKELVGKTSWGIDKYEFPIKQNLLYDVEQDRVVRDMTSLPIELTRWPSAFGHATGNVFVFKQEGEFVVWTYEEVYGE